MSMDSVKLVDTNGNLHNMHKLQVILMKLGWGGVQGQWEGIG